MSTATVQQTVSGMVPGTVTQTVRQGDDLESMLVSTMRRVEGFAKQQKQVDPLEGKKSNKQKLLVLKSLGVPKRHFSGMTAPKQQPLLETVKDWDPKQHWSLTLSGPPGRGKSFLAAWWLYHHFVSIDLSVPSSTKQAWFRAADLPWFEKADIRRMWVAPCLVIDDLGAEYASDSGYFLSTLYSILSNRYDRMLPTIITTNLKPGSRDKAAKDTFTGRYGDERLLDRMREGGRWLEVKGPSFRRAK